MVKLIRLTSEQVDSSFDSTFNTDIIIEKDSQIALRNLTMTTKSEIVTIDGDTDNISFSLNRDVASFTKSITLAHATYDANDYKGLLSDMEDKLNAQLDIVTLANVSLNNKEFGSQFRVDGDHNGRIVIESKQSPYNTRKSELTANIPTITYQDGVTTGPAIKTNAVGIWDKIANEIAGDNNKYMTYMNDPMGYGASIYRTGVYRLDNAGGADKAEGFVVGLTNTNPSTYVNNGIAMTNAQISYGVHLSNKTANYNTIKDGTYTATATAGEVTTAGNANNDVIDWVIAGGKIQCRLYKDSTGATPTILFTEDYDYVNRPKLFPFMVFRGGNAGGNNVRLYKQRFCLDPYLESSLVTLTHEGEEDLGTPLPPPAPTPKESPTLVFLDLGSKELATFLGYINQRHPVTDPLFQRNLNYTGDNSFTGLNQTDNFIVILDNIVLESFDDFTEDNTGGQRKSILATVPNNGGGGIAYEPNTQNFIDIKNNNPISLRNIKARIVRADYEKIETAGLTSMTILIKSKNENA
tara:strand:- start:2254 stop:3825 length:1572 start_codon:yes stop_codon:yes gene_type:complete